MLSSCGAWALAGLQAGDKPQQGLQPATAKLTPTSGGGAGADAGPLSPSSSPKGGVGVGGEGGSDPASSFTMAQLVDHVSDLLSWVDFYEPGGTPGGWVGWGGGGGRTGGGQSSAVVGRLLRAWEDVGWVRPRGHRRGGEGRRGGRAVCVCTSRQVCGHLYTFLMS